MTDGWRRAAAGAGDLFGALGLVLCLPVVILALGLPLALIIRLAIWVTGASDP